MRDIYQEKTFKQFKIFIKKQIASLPLYKVFDLLEPVLQKNDDNYNDYILLLTRFESAESEKHGGTVSVADYKREINSIRLATLKFIDKLNEKDFSEFKREDNLHQKIEELQQNIHKTNKVIGGLESDLQSKSNTISEREKSISLQKEEIQTLKESVKNSEELNRATQNLLEETKKENGELKKKLKISQKQIGDAISQKNELSNELVTENNKIEVLQQKIHDANKKIDDLKNELQNKTKVLSERENSISLQKEEIQNLQKNHANRGELNTTTQNLLKETREENDELKKKLKTSQKELENATVQKNKLSKDAKYLRERSKIEKDKAYEKLKKIQEENSILRQELNDFKRQEASSLLIEKQLLKKLDVQEKYHKSVEAKLETGLNELKNETQVFANPSVDKESFKVKHKSETFGSRKKSGKDVTPTRPRKKWFTNAATIAVISIILLATSFFLYDVIFPPNNVKPSILTPTIYNVDSSDSVVQSKIRELVPKDYYNIRKKAAEFNFKGALKDIDILLYDTTLSNIDRDMLFIEQKDIKDIRNCISNSNFGKYCPVFRLYQVKKGQNMTKISEMFGYDSNVEIKYWNLGKIANPNDIQVGSKLIVRDSVRLWEKRIKESDILSKIRKEFVMWNWEIQFLNEKINIESPLIGQKWTLMKSYYWKESKTKEK